MDGTLGSQTAWMLDGSGVQITSGDELAEIVHRGAGGGLAGRRARDRRPREPRGARRVRARRAASGGAAASASGSSTRSARARGPAALRRARRRRSVQFSHAPSDRDLAERFWAGKTDGAYAYRSLIDSGASSRTARTRRSRSSTRSPGILAGVRRTLDDRRAWHPEEALTLDQAFARDLVAPAWLSGDERRRGTLFPGLAADLVVLDRDPGRPRRAGRRDDGRRPVGAQPAAVGLGIRVLRPLYERKTRLWRKGVMVRT